MNKFASLCALLLLSAASAAPAGTYHGTKSVLGVVVDATIVVDSATAFDMAITGPITLNCKAEAYKMDGNTIDITNAGTAGDCLHDALKANDASVKSAVWDPTKDTVTVVVKVAIISVTIELDHQAFKAAGALRGAVAKPVVKLE
jgi:hypothetical protein